MTSSNEESTNTGFFHLENGFPDEYYAFTDGEISATVERNGGINTINCLDVLEKDGKLYPDRAPTPSIFSKEGRHCGKRVLYGPAIQFLSTSTGHNGRPGRNLFHVPDRAELYPFGFKSSSERFEIRSTYDMAITGRDILFSFTNNSSDRKDLVVSINKDHIRQGECRSLKYQVAEGGDHGDENWIRDTGAYEMVWQELSFDPELNGFFMDGVMRFGYGDTLVFVLFAADREMTFTESKSRYYLTVPWQGHAAINLCLTVSNSRDEAKCRSGRSLADVSGLIAAKTAEATGYAGEAPVFSVEGQPEVAQFSRTAPAFLKAMILAETDSEACIRAAAHKYGFFNLWDQVYPAMAFVLIGDWQTAVKLIRYPLSLLDGTEEKYELTYLGLMIALISENIVAASGDESFQESVYEQLKSLFLRYQSRADQNGMLATCGTCGIDDPAEIGIAGLVWPSCLNALWYAVCRTMENFALKGSDDSIVAMADYQAQLIQENYLKVFYNPENGYLYSSVDAETGKGIPVFQNVSTMGMDFAGVEFLLRPHLKDIAEYQAYQLYHPAGRSAVTFSDPAHEMWKNVIMFQHFAHEMKTARASGLNDEVKRMMNVYLGLFKRTKVAIETHNLTGADGDISQRANWQAFGARALYSGIFEAWIGIQCDMGGFYYVPADFPNEMTVKNFRFRRGTWDIQINGQGKYSAEIVVDGKSIPGTLKVPAVHFDDAARHNLKIIRSHTPYTRSVLLTADKAEIENVVQEVNRLSFSVRRPVHTVCKIYCPAKPSITYDDSTIPFDWTDDDKLLWIDLTMKPGKSLTITC